MRAVPSFLVFLMVGCGQIDQEIPRPPIADSGREAAPAPATTFCMDLMSALCVRAFECSPAGAAAVYGSLDDCSQESTRQCQTPTGRQCPNGYAPDLGRACVAETLALACSDFHGGIVPESCRAACPTRFTLVDSGPEADHVSPARPRDGSADSGTPPQQDPDDGDEWDATISDEPSEQDALGSNDDDDGAVIDSDGGGEPEISPDGDGSEGEHRDRDAGTGSDGSGQSAGSDSDGSGPSGPDALEDVG